MDEPIQNTLQQMLTTDPQGGLAEQAIKQLVVCKGGFTLAAAKAICIGKDRPVFIRAFETLTRLLKKQPARIRNQADLEVALTTLLKWQLVTYDSERERYDLSPGIDAIISPDSTAHQAHYDYYHDLAYEHEKMPGNEKYLKLDIESANLEAAFEWAMATGDYTSAYWHEDACEGFLENLGRFEQCRDWLERLAAKISSDDSQPGHWNHRYLQGYIYNRLGRMYERHPDQNPKQAVASYKASLTYFTPQVSPVNHALTQLQLGSTYWRLANLEDRAGNLKLALAAYQAARVYWSPEIDGSRYALTQSNLGLTYQSLADVENEVDNLKLAALAYEATLVYWTPHTYPLDYAKTQGKIGNIYRALALATDDPENRFANLKKSITAYELSLNYRTSETAPLQYAATQSNLGSVYWYLMQAVTDPEDQVAYLKKALAAYEAALNYRMPETAPLQYAATQNNLSGVYWYLAKLIEQPENQIIYLNQAKAACEEALVYRTPEHSPVDYAATQSNLGTTYLYLAKAADNTEARLVNLKLAINAFEATLVYQTPQHTPLSYAATRNNLGVVYKDLAEIEDREDNLIWAVELYREALTCYTPQSPFYEYGGALTNLGEVYCKLAELTSIDEYLPEAFAALEEASNHVPPQAISFYAELKKQYGHAFKLKGDLSSAINCWREAEGYFRQSGNRKEAELMLQWITEAEAK